MGQPGRDEQIHKAPQWVKVSGALAVVLIVAFTVLHLAGGGFHHHHFPGSAATQGP